MRFKNGLKDLKQCLEADFIIKCKVVREDLMEVVVKDASTSIPKLLELTAKLGVEVSEVSYKRPTLNEVFIHLTGRELRDSLEDFVIPHRFIRRW
ncbi:MAG: hypothetical protein QXH57_00755 [Sulfolobales archaeon]